MVRSLSLSPYRWSIINVSNQVFVATFALFGGSGTPQTMPIWALNPDGEQYNYGTQSFSPSRSTLADPSLDSDYCVKLT